MSWLSNSLFGRNKNPAGEANKYLNQIPGTINPYYQPYINAGQGALNNVQGEYGKLTNDPNAIYNKLASGYEPSKGYQFNLQQALNAGQNAAASGGMLGTPQNQQQSQQIASGLASQDFQNYLANNMGLYGMGLQGQQGLESQGWDASKSLAENLANVLGRQGQLAYEGQAAQNANRGANWSNLFGLAGQALPYLFGI